MTDNPNDLTPEARDLLARLNRPIPLWVRREMQVCADMDAFAAALDATRWALGAAQTRPGELSPLASAAAVHASWRDSLAELQASFERTDQRAQALIRAIKTLFVLE